MEKNKKHIDDLFKSELGNYTETPPPASWDALEKRLNNIPPKAPGGMSAKGFWLMGASAVILLLSVPALRKMANKTTTVAPYEIAANTPQETPLQQNDNETKTNGQTPEEATTTNNNVTADQPEADIEQQTTKQEHELPKDKVSQNKSLTATINQKETRRQTTTKTANNRPDKAHNTYKAGITNTTANNNQQKLNESITTYNAAAEQKNSYTTGPALQAEEQITPKAASKEEDATEKNKEKELKSNTKITEIAIVKPPHKRTFKLLEAGVKGGYERGFNNDASQKMVVSPYLQFNITSKLSVMVQPAVKSSYNTNRRIGNPSSYYKVNDGSSTTTIQTDTTPVVIVGSTERYNVVTYIYSQTHDSIVKTSSIGRRYTEFELPLLLKYRTGKNLSVYGGLNTVYGRSIDIKENTFTSEALSMTGSVQKLIHEGGTVPTAPEISTVITYPGTSIAAYNGPAYTNNQGNILRLGYMVGFCYEYKKKWLFDGMIQQGTAKTYEQGGYNLNTALSAPYFRFTIGYKLTN